jgi:hypothetical protein
MAFETLYNNVGRRAIDEIIPALIARLDEVYQKSLAAMQQGDEAADAEEEKGEDEEDEKGSGSAEDGAAGAGDGDEPADPSELVLEGPFPFGARVRAYLPAVADPH